MNAACITTIALRYRWKKPCAHLKPHDAFGVPRENAAIIKRSKPGKPHRTRSDGCVMTIIGCGRFIAYVHSRVLLAAITKFATWRPIPKSKLGCPTRAMGGVATGISGTKSQAHDERSPRKCGDEGGAAKSRGRKNLEGQCRQLLKVSAGLGAGGNGAPAPDRQSHPARKVPR